MPSTDPDRFRIIPGSKPNTVSILDIKFNEYAYFPQRFATDLPVEDVPSEQAEQIIDELTEEIQNHTYKGGD